MKENSTGGINYSTIKKSLSIALVFFSIVAASLLGIICANSNIFIRQNNLPAVDVNAASSEGSALSNYLTWRLFKDKNMELGGTKVKHIPKNATHAIRYPLYDRKGTLGLALSIGPPEPVDRAFMILAEINNPKNALSLNDTYYEISDEEDYKKFVELTHQKSEKTVGWRTVDYGLAYTLDVPVKESYYVYPFMYSSGTASVNFIQIEDKWYRDMGIRHKSYLGKDYTIIEGELNNDETKVGYSKTYENFRLTVALTDDITVTLNSGEIRKEEENIQYFAGIFDGQGHTINFKGSDKYYSDETIGVKGFSEAYSPFCSYNDGIIKNVKLNYETMGNNYLLIDDGWTDVSYTGGIVGNNHGTVNCCIVNSPRVRSERYSINAYFGALTGYNNGTVKNCIVDGEYWINAHADQWHIGHSSGIHAYWGTAAGNKEVTHCLFKATITEAKDIDKNEDYIWSPANYCTAENGYKGHESVDNCYDLQHGFTGEQCVNLGYSNIGEDEKSWYFCSIYSQYPLLKPFVKWKTLYIVPNNTAYGSVSPGSMKIPADADGRYGLNDAKGPQRFLSVLERKINATPAQGFAVNKWSFNGERTKLTVSFTKNFTKLALGSYYGNIKVYDKYSNETISSNTTFYIPEESEVKITTNKSSVNKTFTYYDIGADKTIICKYLYNSITVEFDSYIKNDDGTYSYNKTMRIIIEPSKSYLILAHDKEIKTFAPTPTYNTIPIPETFRKEYDVHIA